MAHDIDDDEDTAKKGEVRFEDGRPVHKTDADTDDEEED